MSRSVIHESMPCHTQSEVALSVGADGRRTPDHRYLYLEVFQILAFAVPLFDHLTANSPDAASGDRAQPAPSSASAGPQRSDGSPEISRPLQVAVVGAGAGALPAVLVHLDPRVRVHAVDLDAGAPQSVRLRARSAGTGCAHTATRPQQLHRWCSRRGGDTPDTVSASMQSPS